MINKISSEFQLILIQNQLLLKKTIVKTIFSLLLNTPSIE